MPPTPSSDAFQKRAKFERLPPPVGWRRLLPFRILRTSKGTQVHVAWKQAVFTVALIIALGWVGLAGAAYLFVKYRRDFPGVSFSHMLLYPVKKDAYRAARGDYHVALGKKFLEEQKIREAFTNLSVGLGLAPRNRDGRLLLSQFFTVWGRPDRSAALLKEGLPFHSGDKEYLQTIFTFLLQRQSDFEVIAIADDLLAKAGPRPAPDDRLRLISLAKATAQFHRGYYDAAEDTLARFRLNDWPDADLLEARIDWERGEKDSALAKLESMSDQLPENEQVYSQHAALLRESGKDDQLRRLALLRQIAFPDRARARVDLLYLHDRANDETNLQRDLDELLRDFAGKSDALLAIADFAANTGRSDLALRIYRHCKERNLPWEGPALMVVEAHVVAKRYRQALDACDALQKENPEWSKRYYSVFNGLQAIANFGLGDVEAANLFLSNFLNQSGVRAENLVAVSNRLVGVGAFRQARQVLAQAVKTDPLNQPALAGLIRLDLDAGHADSVSEHIRQLMTMRKPPRPLLETAYAKLGSDRFLFAPGRAALLDELKKTIRTSPRQQS